MIEPADIKRQFRTLNQDLISAYESELHERRQENERASKSRQAREKRTRGLMNAARIDVDALDSG